MGIQLTTTMVRNLLQLPERPFEDPFQYDGTSYWDLSQREPCTIFSVSGMVSMTPFLFRSGVDYQLTAGTIDWTLPGAKKPDFGSTFVVDYTYSRLGGVTASTAAQNGTMMAAQDLGSTYPYGASTSAGISTDALATMIASFVAAREACRSLSSTEIDIAQKSRRGAILLDDSKKTTDWLAEHDKWDAKYKQYLTMVRPSGMVRAFSLIRPTSDNLVLGEIGREVFDFLEVLNLPISGFPYGGLI